MHLVIYDLRLTMVLKTVKYTSTQTVFTSVMTMCKLGKLNLTSSHFIIDSTVKSIFYYNLHVEDPKHTL